MVTKGRGGLSKKVRMALGRVRRETTDFEPAYVPLTASLHLLDRLKLPRETIVRAKMLESHTFLLRKAISAAKARQPVSVRTAKIIIRKALETLRASIARKKGELSLRDLAFLQEKLEQLELNDGALKQMPDSQQLYLDDLKFLEAALEMNQNQLSELIGAKNFNLHARALLRVFAAIGKKS